MGFPVFAQGDVLNASDMNAVGLWHLRTQTVTAGSSSAVISNVFSADYENYRIVFSGFSANVGGQSIALQLNNSTGSTYFMGGFFCNFATTTFAAYGPAAAVRWTDIAALDISTNGAAIDLFQPFATARTSFLCNSVRTGATSNSWYMMNGIDTNAVSNTGFTIAPVSAGTTFSSGTVRVYGYRN